MLPSRSVADGDRPILGTFSPAQNRAILIAAVTCASISLVTTLITLRWFLLMKRLFRHRLVLLLILSDTFKALWYFVFPIVVFARGRVASSSSWCQASGFLLSLAIEASDFAILLIALHAVLYVFRPPIRFGEGGLYPYRRWLPVAWLGFPILAACLAFVNRGKAYATAGTFCYLPQRPFWYRLALAWIPRYLILFTIVGMYAAVSIYVRVKFRSFKNLARSDPPSGENSARRPSLEDIDSPSGVMSPAMVEINRDQNDQSHLAGAQSPREGSQSPPKHHSHQPWDSMNFITNSTPWSDGRNHGVEAADFAQRLDGSQDSVAAPAPAVAILQIGAGNGHNEKLRQSSEVPSYDGGATSRTGSSSFGDYEDRLIVDPLKRARIAIRQQLRFLFIYPAVYVLMWAFPFANHCLLYSDRLASRPIFWLQIISTCALSLQAAANCLVFSWREKPWRRVDENSKLALPFWRHRSATFLKRMSHNGSAAVESRKSSSVTERRETATTEETLAERPARPTRGPDWWEAEGRKRKDSVWMGTDLMSYITSRSSDGTKSQNGDEEESRPASKRSR